MNNLAVLLEKLGKLAEAEVFGWREVAFLNISPGH